MDPGRDHDPQRSHAQSHNGGNRRQQHLLSPPASRATSVAGPSTPGPSTPLAEGSADDYFDRLSQAPSHLSRQSVQSLSRFPSLTSATSRPRLESTTSRPSIRIRRRSSVASNISSNVPPEAPVAAPAPTSSEGGYHGGRPRSISQPTSGARAVDAPPAARIRRMPAQAALPRLTEEGSRPTMAELGIPASPSPLSPLSPTASMPERAHSLEEAPEPAAVRGNRLRRVSRLLMPGFSRRESQAGEVPAMTQAEDEYHDQLVDYLDTIDPEVQMLSTLTNVQNSLFVPDLGSWVNRRPTYTLSPRDLQHIRPASAEVPPPPPPPPHEEPQIPEEVPEEPIEEPPSIQRSDTITSRLTDSHFAALPHGRTLEGWTADEKWELDDHVRHMLHSRRSRWKRRMKGFGQYVRRPLGFFVTLYATLITLFGLAWVLFLIGWIYVGDNQIYVIHVVDSVLVALFGVVGYGMAPFRAVDSYRLFFIVRYSRMIENADKRSRSKPSISTGASGDRKVGPPPAVANDDGSVLRHDYANDATRPAVGSGQGDLDDVEDIPDTASDTSQMSGYYVLTAKQRKRLSHHQKKLARSHSFYKPEETFTHYSFPLGYLMAVVILLDFHSILQICLGSTTWSINYRLKVHDIVTSCILSVSICCNLVAGLVITIGGRKTRKKDIHDLMSRQELTGDAIKHLEHKRKKQQKKEEKMNRSGSNSDQEGLNGASGEASGSDKGIPGHEKEMMDYKALAEQK
ncbi:integral membrane protein [Purpureocillium lilacinum]|uniref:Integral membrane protein n=1 Tax=Purpureocillium lilacinum TaxID=33203 RepID=A0A179GSC4_PURLI|nr:integral membrane protein [Purpureocillium lilacinum]OAQ80827.1 integral membrane protein [Purpureocillium lilacinum]GJN76407.1 hypothetical protein PLICBS_010520 [Purpureocillium lilacinum]